ncbi:MAG: bacterioferritin [Firmicutes bacterium]|nr:bacterioferritin [Bacillota bacterium]
MGERPSTVRKNYTLPVPYPVPQVVAPNAFYARLLLEDYAGMASELTAIHQYLYHHYYFEKELSAMVRSIAIVEMKHLELLAETILLLGEAPEYRTLSHNFPAYWNASYVYYGKDLCDRLAADIAAEQEAICNYRRHQELIADPHIRELLARIIMDEEHHLKLFKQAMHRYCPGWSETQD